MHGIGWGWWLLMSLGMVGFWALVVFAILAVVRAGSSEPERRVETPERPLDALQRRLAAGEISVEEYTERRDALIGTSETRSPAAHLFTA